MKAVLDDRDIQIHDIAVLELLVARHAVAYLMVDRSADRLGIRDMAAGRIVERRGNGLLYVDHIVVAQLVEFTRGDARFDMRSDEIEYFRGEPPRYTHFFDFFGGFDADRHTLPQLFRKS